MKRTLFILMALFVSNLVFGQLSLEKNLSIDDYSGYGNRCVIGYLPDYDYVIYQQEYVSEWNDQSQTSTVLKNRIKIFDFSYTLIKEIDLKSLGNASLFGFENENKKMNIAISQYLFNQDSKIEFILKKDSKIQVYNEDLVLIQEFVGSTQLGLGDEMELLEIPDNSNIVYKLKIGQYAEYQFYSVPWNPFIVPTTTKSASITAERKLFQIYPNPVKNELKIIYTSSFDGNIVITDLNGKKLKQVEVITSHNEQLVDLSELTNGMYFCQLITDDNQKQTVKFIKED